MVNANLFSYARSYAPTDFKSLLPDNIDISSYCRCYTNNSIVVYVVQFYVKAAVQKWTPMIQVPTNPRVETMGFLENNAVVYIPGGYNYVSSADDIIPIGIHTCVLVGLSLNQ